MSINKLSQDEINELSFLLKNLQEKLSELSPKISQITEKLSNDELNIKHGISYFESKYNILLIYIIYLNYYISLKVKGIEIHSNKELLTKLIYLKNTIRKNKSNR